MNDISDPIELFIISLILFFSMVITLGSCESGEMIVNKFDAFNDAIGQCNWHLFPIEMQQMLIILMANVQQPKLICGFGNIQCSRETFKKVIWLNTRSLSRLISISFFNFFFLCFFTSYQTINASFSYFMMLRRING